ncbi:HlyD family efflux transporter periplasmic adaptor subunit [Paludisphaera mucosa]|uniref:HlyD family efflux transporter periplasmic adaptor subunit n=1 Tax=Paludisphaera mucosa TaxID=3030827 RepID=A0ABT6FGK6_9BACT|nr:HlyD family efflux transporter periplasmic adaptor subunit [Paludisphaera mucosa]MDG3006538.1 HlyD family efflux transporter periplasmic adaptor subunit [Paludisphaera mucosa]
MSHISTGAGGRRPSRSKALAAVVVLALVAARPSDARAQAASASAGESRVHALARLEPATGLVTVGSRPGQRIDEIKVAVGDDVTAGQVLAVLEGRKQAEAQLALAEIQKQQMTFQRKAKKDKFLLEREQFDKANEPRLVAATKVADELRKLLDKATPLYNLSGLAGPVDRARLEDGGRYVELFAKTTQAELDKNLLEAEKALTVKKRALEDEQLADANPEFLLPDAQIALAQAGIEQTQVLAPRAGKILDVVAHPGEVGTGQLLVLGDVSVMVAVAEVFQSEVLRVKVGDAARVSILDQSIAGKVQRIGSIVGRNQAANLDPRALKDVRVVKVWVALDDPKLAARLINMEAEVAITPGGGG